MADSFYPFVGNSEDYQTEIQTELPLFKEFAYDFKTNDFVINHETKDFVIVEGIEALKVWIYMAIMTNRYEHLIYSWDYGTELITLVGQKFTKGLTESEAFRFVKDALMINPYITDVINKEVSFNDNIVTLKLIVKTVYGEVGINVRK